MNKKVVEKQIESLEEQVKEYQAQIDKLKKQITNKSQPDLNNLYKDYLHVWLYFNGFGDTSYLININSVVRLDDTQIGFTGIVLKLNTLNDTKFGIDMYVACKLATYKFDDLTYLYQFKENDDNAISIKKQIDSCIEENLISIVTVDKAKEILLSYLYESIHMATEYDVLEETLNLLK